MACDVIVAAERSSPGDEVYSTLEAQQCRRICANTNTSYQAPVWLGSGDSDWPQIERSTAQDKSGHSGETSTIRYRKRSQRYHKTVLS